MPFFVVVFPFSFFTTVLSQWDFSHEKFRLLSHGRATCDHATQPMVHAGCFSVSTIHASLTWTTGSLMCAQMLCIQLYAGCSDTVRESALEVDSRRKIPCCITKSNLRQLCAGAMLYQLSYNPTQACCCCCKLLLLFFFFFFLDYFFTTVELGV